MELLLSQSNLAQIVRGSPVVASNSIDKRLIIGSGSRHVELWSTSRVITT